MSAGYFFYFPFTCTSNAAHTCWPYSCCTCGGMFSVQPTWTVTYYSRKDLVDKAWRWFDVFRRQTPEPHLAMAARAMRVARRLLHVSAVERRRVKRRQWLQALRQA